MNILQGCFRGTYTDKPPPDVVERILEATGSAEALKGDSALMSQGSRSGLDISGWYRLPDVEDENVEDFIIVGNEDERGGQRT